MSQWYYAVDGQAAGPVDDAALVQLVQNGTINRTTPIAEAGADAWSTVAEQAARLGLDAPSAPAPAAWEAPAPADPAPSAWDQPPATPAPGAWDQPSATPAPSAWEQPGGAAPTPSPWEQPGGQGAAPGGWEAPAPSSPAPQPWQGASTPAPNAWDQPAAGGAGGAAWTQPAAEWGTPGAVSGFGTPSYGAPGGAMVPAELGKRFLALIIDSAIGFVAYIAALIVGGILGSASETLGGLVMLIAVLGVIGFNIWNVFIRQGKTGQTIGKAKMGIKLVRMSDGQPIGAGMSFARYVLGSVIAILCYVDYWWVFTNPLRQRLCDVVLKTQVVTA